MNNNINLRIRFRKTDAARFISHLDLNRAMARSFRRAKLPIAYSEGFNPRPKLVFGLNLSIGAESECEILDTQLTHEVDFEEIKASLNASLPDHIEVYDVYVPEMPLKSIGFAEYVITVPCTEDICDKILSAFTPPVMILKQTKSSQAVTDISGNIKSIDASYTDGFIIIKAVLTSGNNDYLNPEYVIKVIGEKISEDIAKTDYRIMRKEVYDASGNTFR
ncbi:MAG: DUF2344 domain-containing protein [Clostridia bacterium]|nr:DUF2344 domain-containing protein [Clostridia bacterium]